MAAGQKKAKKQQDIAGRNLAEYIIEIQAIYLSDSRPWVIGYSGGKDSTTILQLIFTALIDLDESQRIKPIYVISSDTLVETPLVIDLLNTTLSNVDSGAKELGLPITTAKVMPEINDTFWVNLLGRGYPTPTKSFRWCTERMKIDPVSRFIQDQVAEHGEVIVVLGSRISESSTRAQTIKKHKIEGKRLATHTSLPSAYVYTPIEDWSADDVWGYLLSGPAPWGGDHRELFELYRDSNAGECPLVIDTSTPSCGNSRFGCWVCTVVTEDKAMQGLIKSGESWLTPLYEFREKLAETSKPENKTKYRNFKRRSGKVHVSREGSASTHIPGPYWMEFRQQMLRQLLEIQKQYQEEERDIELVTEAELQEIRRQWKLDPNEPDWKDSLPLIYREVFGKDLDWTQEDAGAFTALDEDLLQELGKKYGVSAEMVKKLLEIELSLDGLGKRSGIYNKIEQVFNKDWGSLEDALMSTKSENEKISTYDDQEKELNSIYESLQQ